MMEEEDETPSQQSPRDSLSPAPILPTSNVTVASATKPPPSSSSQSPLALVVQTPSVNRNGRIGGGGGGGRDDCWSEEATKVLINAWGDRFSEPGKGTLKQQQWHEVAEIVNSSGQCKYAKTDVQCKNRIDTVKKKYKQEKAKNGPSKWAFFKKLESLIGGGGKAHVGGRSSGPMRWHFRKRSASESESESEPERSAESLPPPQPLLPKRVKMGESGVGDVAKAILGFTEAYEKAETAKLKLMMELEKERMKFAKEMELQRMQFLKTQMEITRNNQEEERSKREGDDDDDRNVKNNGDEFIAGVRRTVMTMCYVILSETRLWDDTVAGPTPENGLGKLRKHVSLATVQPPPLSTDQVTRSIVVTKGNNNVRGLRNLKMGPGRAPDSPTGSSSTPGTPLTPGTPCDHFGPFSADKIPSAGEVDASSLTTYEWIVINALDR
ncbi:hypothetical protein HID58_020624 [Brassica napus]|uniref:Myb/SANT-like DNA-binding domain-containing protein n=1 Tax=Brassica napus TaxID=3708 RepID=A0ABQ8CU97_BRANA|nr:hypothetical protein HID58_020624 [Brassica napus]